MVGTRSSSCLDFSALGNFTGSDMPTATIKVVQKLHCFIFALLDINEKMRVSVISIICALLQVNGETPRSWTLLPNIVVVEVDGFVGQQPLTCLESAEEVMRRDGEQEEDITWQKDGAEESERGNMYLVGLEESLGGGNYTCHSKDGALLNHTVVLIQEEETERKKIIVKTDEGYIKCSTPNYNGEFRCSWDWHPYRLGRVVLVRAQRVSIDNESVQCSVDASGHRWTCPSGEGDISCSVDSSGHGITCLDKQHCPYAEETRRVSLTVYVRSNRFLVEKYSQHFYLSEIVKPDKVEISKVNKTTIEWSYPSSWSSPHSYFPLTFEIKKLRKDMSCTHPKATKSILVYSTEVCQLTVGHRVRAVCVRAQDALCNSQWSEWSLYRKERRRKNKRKIYKADKLLNSYGSPIL